MMTVGLSQSRPKTSNDLGRLINSSRTALYQRIPYYYYWA